ncbi:hypothetical protein GCM10009557_01420 [Virgisporangium ochraceum]|uniref:Uncharacterized protein n=1 Tax=Virgisporangium ochraceum TaxID=65505 RepID=A0A8J4EGZ2_9ACTN|nr:hypothetical protein [Virgisporangium ochraceum]GIJ74173.1 hypothetical protein Voc01_090900 [Virgisporangium ochraceum]
MVLPHLLRTLPTSTTCVPGRDGIPDSPLGRLLCGDYLTDAPTALSQFAHLHWPQLLATLVVLAGIRGGWELQRRRVWRRHAAQARWLEIVPPVTATPAATLGLWRLLATLLPAPRRWALRPHRLVWEVHATASGMRCGLWIPPGVNPTAVTRILHRAWPGARVEHTTEPTDWNRDPVFAVRVQPSRPDWLPLVDDPVPPVASRRREFAPPEEDRIRAVFDGLAAAGRTGSGLLQVIVGRAPGRRVAVLRRATVNPQRAFRPRRSARPVAVAAVVARSAAAAVLDILTPGTSRSSSGRAADPHHADLARQARTKYAVAPHLLVAVHATAAGPTIEAARAAAQDIASGYSLLSPHWRHRRIRRPGPSVTTRWASTSRMSLASVAEVAALTGLPAEPAAYGLPAAASRRLPVSRDIFTASEPRDADIHDAESPSVWTAS